MHAIDTAQADWMETQAAEQAAEYEPFEYEVMEHPAYTSRTYRRDCEEWWHADEHRAGRRAAWRHYRAGKRATQAERDTPHSPDWLAGYESIRAALVRRWYVQRARLEVAEAVAQGRVSEARYAYWNLHAVSYDLLEAEYARLDAASGALWAHMLNEPLEYLLRGL